MSTGMRHRRPPTLSANQSMNCSIEAYVNFLTCCDTCPWASRTTQVLIFRRSSNLIAVVEVYSDKPASAGACGTCLQQLRDTLCYRHTGILTYRHTNIMTYP